MSDELKPCPFCGDKAEIAPCWPSLQQIKCTRCNSGTGLFADEPPALDRAIAAWNTRAAEARIERLEASHAELVAALTSCRLELDYCQRQLAAHGQTGRPDDSVSRALKAGAAALSNAKALEVGNG